jgi:hypothetical protein
LLNWFQSVRQQAVAGLAARRERSDLGAGIRNHDAEDRQRGVDAHRELDRLAHRLRRLVRMAEDEERDRAQLARRAASNASTI